MQKVRNYDRWGMKLPKVEKIRQVDKKATSKKVVLPSGFKQIPETLCACNEFGRVFNLNTGRISSPRTIKTKYGDIRIGKALLWAFQGITPNSGMLIYLNGNKQDLRLSNIRYANAIPGTPEKISYEDYIKAIRCYRSLNQKNKHTLNNFVDRVCFKTIARQRSFIGRNKKAPYIEVFAEWLCYIHATETMRKHGLNTADYRKVVNMYTNRLINEILQDYRGGRLIHLPYIKTKRERYKEETAALHEFGIKRPRKKHKTPQELYKDFADFLESMNI